MAEAELLQGLIEVPKAEVQLLLEAGQLLIELGKTQEAQEVFTGVAALLPTQEWPLICLGNLFFAMGRFDRALRFHQEALGRNPESLLAQAHIGEALIFLKRRDEAKTRLEAAATGGDPEVQAFANSLLDAMAAGVL